MRKGRKKSQKAEPKRNLLKTRFLVDTNVWSYSITQTSTKASKLLGVAKQYYCDFVLLELLRVSLASKRIRNRAVLERNDLLQTTPEITQHAGRLRDLHPQRGPMDLLIAAVALHYKVPIATDNVEDFHDIKGLEVLDIREVSLSNNLVRITKKKISKTEKRKDLNGFS